MNRNAKLIALVIDEPSDDFDPETLESTGAQRLIREEDGRVTLEPVESAEEFDRIARSTGCFRRGSAIRDPKTKEVIGYEMEEIEPGLTLVPG